MAKMISNYAINVMGMEPDTSKTCNFNDIAGEDAEMKGYIKTACQLGLMGYKGDAVTKADAFNPNLPVTRAMFATLFARMMYDNKYATATDAADWAGPSLDALKADGLLKNINPNLTEIRGYVWIVFDRANQ
jgi:S-layer homology domain